MTTPTSDPKGSRNFESELERYAEALWPQDWRQELLDQANDDDGDNPKQSPPSL